jgi:hypothetical protein
MIVTPQWVQSAVSNMGDPDSVKTFAINPANIHPAPLIPSGPSWSDLSLANGYPSLLLLFSVLQQQGLVENGEGVVHSYVLKIKEAIESQGLFDLSLFGGVSGICFALKHASCEGTRYQNMLHSLHSFLAERVERAYLEPLKQNQRQFLPTSPRLYDPIQGISGIGRYALDNLSLSPFVEVAEKIAKALVILSRPLLYKGQSVPGWFLSPNDLLNARNRSTCPKGNFNLGLAHGVTGILAYLSIASLHGIDVEGQKGAIGRIASWIRSKSVLYNNAILWPYHVSFEDEMEGKTPTINGFKDAWCYGVPGIARSLFLAGKALKDEELKTFAATAFGHIFNRRQEAWHLPGPSLCHGIAGLLLITQEMSKEEGCESLAIQVLALKEILLSFYKPEALWGFKDVEPGLQGNLYAINKPGFLEGAAGVLLTLLAPHSKWHLPLLIHA